MTRPAEDSLAATVLDGLDPDERSTVLAARAANRQSPFVARYPRHRDDVRRITAQANDPRRHAAFDDPGLETVDASAEPDRTVASRW